MQTHFPFRELHAEDILADALGVALLLPEKPEGSATFNTCLVSQEGLESTYLEQRLVVLKSFQLLRSIFEVRP